MKEFIKVEENFLVLFQDFSIDLINIYNESEDQKVKDFLSNASVFDGLVSVCIRELRKKPIK
jgi:hypothetical protein